MIPIIRSEELVDLLRKKRIINVAQEMEIKRFLSQNAKIEELLVRSGFINEIDLMQIIAQHKKILYHKIDLLELDSTVVTQHLPGRFCQKHSLVVTEKENTTLTICIGNPFTEIPIEDIRNMTGLDIQMRLSTKTDVLNTINYFYGLKESLSAAEAEITRTSIDTGNLEQLYTLEEATELEPTAQPIIRAVNHLFYSAFDQRASDIHIEPKRTKSTVRFRIDGVLHDVLQIQESKKSLERKVRKLHSAIISRIKMMAYLDIAEKRRPQDGRIKIIYRGREIEIRVSTLPVAFGEKIVLRVQDSQVLLQNLENLGFDKTDLGTFYSIIKRPFGIILVTGPTGSGKTTTLYSALRYLSSPEINITTIEDPIELIHEAFNQIGVKPNIGINFASSLRTILRQDPDVIMVGEIRDNETARNAIQAALTGHLVFSSLHTNDASSAITRLMDMEIEPYLIASTLIGVIAQRLVRKICRYCIETYHPTEDELSPLQLPFSTTKNLTLKRGKGCIECRDTGYLGREAIFEIMPITEKMTKLVTDRVDSLSLSRVAREQGMVTLREAALRKMIQCVTTPQEVIRCIYS
ncbi:GspE/PulE family protein [candidate division CSSED10-310 bacterium]|uniref:GspE/PulE family protein n=1 Tax=candidate division CSSED10-310 bacterium TaxID=2855610 RepID=A0ABV6Z016_UNCC1